MTKSNFPLFIYSVLFFVSFSCTSHKTVDMIAEKWTEVELTFESSGDYENPYTDVDFWVEFNHITGDKLIRPGFWDGGNAWKVRFASPADTGEWVWKSLCSNPDDQGLNGKEGKITCRPYTGNNEFTRHGLLKMSEGRRNVIHADGTPFLMIGDTPWALPWRGTVKSVADYAKNRQDRGFNTALLMSLQPDRGVDGPRDRTVEDGFGVAFEDLKEGHINQLNVSYFQYLDSLRNILVDHGIVPVFQPVFAGGQLTGR